MENYQKMEKIGEGAAFSMTLYRVNAPLTRV
jgi:hypothetical protein